MSFDCGAVTHVGRGRDNNEDAVYAAPDDTLFVVCDGIGGADLGERAAALFVETIRARCEGKPPSREALSEAFLAANQRIFDTASGLGLRMGTCATVVWLDPQADAAAGLIGHVGNCRAWLFPAGAASGWQVTHDHTLVEEEGMCEVEARAAAHRNIITRDVGLHPRSATDEDAWLEIVPLRIAVGGTVVLASDGVGDYLSRAQLWRLVTAGATSAEELAQRIIGTALDAQDAARAGDNLSVVVARRPPSGRRAPEPTPFGNVRFRATAAVFACAIAVGALFAALLHVRDRHRPDLAASEMVLSPTTPSAPTCGTEAIEIRVAALGHVDLTQDRVPAGLHAILGYGATLTLRQSLWEAVAAHMEWTLAPTSRIEFADARVEPEGVTWR